MQRQGLQDLPKEIGVTAKRATEGEEPLTREREADGEERDRQRERQYGRLTATDQQVAEPGHDDACSEHAVDGLRVDAQRRLLR
jgi:hypothetical protein